MASHLGGSGLAFCGTSPCASRGPSHGVAPAAFAYACRRSASRNRLKLWTQSASSRLAPGNSVIIGPVAQVDEMRLDRDAGLVPQTRNRRRAGLAEQKFPLEVHRLPATRVPFHTASPASL